MLPPKVFLSRRLPDTTMRRLEQETRLTFNPENRSLSPQELRHAVAGQDALISLLTDRIDSELLDAAPNLKVVSNFAVGYNNIDLSAAKKRKVMVTNTPGVLTDATADMTWALLMAVSRRLIEGDSMVRQEKWTGWEPLQLLGGHVTGATLGLIGLGRIGQAVARRAAGFGMNILAWNRSLPDPKLIEQLGITMMSIDEVCQQSDYVSLHLSLNESTKHILNADRLAMMKPTAYVINTARGPHIDEAALVHALRSNQIAGAGLDVYEREPILQTGLVELDNVVLAPHLGSATYQTRAQMGEMVVNNVLAACQGKRPPNLVEE
jgi:glyoxylate reductase